jgi:apolipoprotein N-acyltransferase
VVAGTTGISAVIAPDGAELVRTDFFEPAYLDLQVRLKTKLTPATRWAPILQWVLVAAAGAAILVGIRHNGWFVRPTRLRSRPRGDSEDAGTRPGEPPPAEGDAQTAPDEGDDDIPPKDGGAAPEHDTLPEQGGLPDFGRDRGAT